MKLITILLFFIFLISPNVESKPDFAKMMDEKREQIKEMRKNGIPINRTIRYSEIYPTYK